MSVTYREIEAAARRIAPLALVTPLIESPALNDRLGGRLLIKPETLQRGGAFKVRGATNRLSQFNADQRKRGVVAFSSGNHAQGVAIAARHFDMPALIVMPSDAPAIKVAATRGYGAEVRFYDRYNEDRVAVAEAIADERGAVVVPAYDDEYVVIGQGTVGLEIVRQAADLGAELDLLLTPLGGGGLAAGIGVALEALSPRTRIVGVEPAAFDDTQRSLNSGHRECIDVGARSICDALQAISPGEITFAINRRTLSDVATVTDAEVAAAMRYAFQILKLVVEPGGCVGLAALLAGKIELSGRTAALVLSGGNVDPALFARVLAEEI